MGSPEVAKSALIYILDFVIIVSFHAGTEAEMISNVKESLDIVKELIVSQDLYDYEFYFVNHPAEINWRQNNADIFSRITNIASGIQFNNNELIPILGRELLSLKTLHQLTSPRMPLFSMASRVKDPDNRIYHVPMMNIHLDIPIDISTLNQALKELISTDYYLVRTDRFFHIYGSGLMTEEEWKDWNLKFLMTDFLVSPRYIGHCLKRGCNLLRANATKFLKITVPMVLQMESAETRKYHEVKIFAVIKHTSQFTEGGEPYFRHLFDVEEHAVHIAMEIGLSEKEVSLIRQAAILHDSIEDTDTDYEDIAQLTNTKVADLVAILSNDKRKPRKERNRSFLGQIEMAPLQARVIKLADIYTNLLSIEKEIIAGKEINFDYLEKAKAFLDVLGKQLKNTLVFKNAITLVASMGTQNDHRYRYAV